VQDTATGTYTFGYDNMNRLTSAGANYSFTSVGTLTVQYGYDLASNRTSMTDPQSVTTAYAYDTLNRLHTLTYNGQTPNFVFAYDDISRRTSLTRPNGVETTYGYDPVSQLKTVIHSLGTTALDGATYTYDNAGNRLTRTDKRLGTTLTYGYDNIYQLKTATQGTTTKESYTYDLVGNRLSSLNVSPYNYNSSNELTSTPSGSYTYDANGNTLSDPSGKSYTWDYENRLTQVVLAGSGGTVNFKYDPFGRRVQKSGPLGTTNYLYDGMNLLEEVDNSGNVLAKYTQGEEFDEELAELRSGATNYYESDGLGSISSVSNSLGALANTYAYDSFGKLTASTGTLPNPFQYTGRELDAETGLYFYRARYYDPIGGRFLSEDPAAFEAGENFYPYAGNNPVIFSDPFGLQSSVPPGCSPPFAAPCGPPAYGPPTDPTPPPPPTPAVPSWWPGPGSGTSSSSDSSSGAGSSSSPSPQPAPGGSRQCDQKNGKWHCTAKCHINNFSNLPNVPGFVTGEGWGNSAGDAQLAAEKNANTKVPRGTYKRHCSFKCDQR